MDDASKLQFKYYFNSTYIITSMKHTHLSNFQKQQYTAYLEAQLQKFSAFMLSQKKQSQKYKALEQAVSYHATIIDQLQSKYQMNDFYWHQNVANLEHLAKKCEKIQDLDSRVRRLEDRERFDCDKQTRKKYQLNKKQSKTERQYDQRQKALEMNMNELTKKLKKIDEQIIKNKENHLPKFGSADNEHTLVAVQEIIEKRVKKLQKKMKKYFANRFEEIQMLMKKSKKNQSRSPIARTPIQMSTMSHYEVDMLEKPLSQFKLQDHSINKSQISTILRQSNTTASNKHKSKVSSSKPTKEGKIKEKQQSKSRSKSKTKQKDEKKKKIQRSRSKSVSRSRKLDCSVSRSDNSDLKSSVSRSKSRISNNESLDMRKVNIKKKDKRNKYSRSKSKSNRSEISMHQRCKKRQDFQTTTTHLRKKDECREDRKLKKKMNK